MSDMKDKPESYWRQKLTPEQYRVLREAGTEPAFTGELVNNHADGKYHCAACMQVLFSSDTKYETAAHIWGTFSRMGQPSMVAHGFV
jgi:peptide-methionine (R)-S-oxide reductase